MNPIPFQNNNNPAFKQNMGLVSFTMSLLTQKGRMLEYLRLIILFPFLWMGLPAFGQNFEVDSLYQIETTERSVYMGRFLKSDNGQLVFKTLENGLLSLESQKIKSGNQIDSKRVKKGKYYPADRLAYRSFVNPTGRGIGKGDFHYSNFMIFGHSAIYGVTNRFSLGVGTIAPLVLFEYTPYVVSPKLSFSSKNQLVHFSVGTNLILRTSKISNWSTHTYSNITIGKDRMNVTLGVGIWVFENGNPSVVLPRFNFTASITTKTSLKIDLAFQDHQQLRTFLVFGCRTSGKRIAVDYGFLLLEDYELNGPFFPMLGFTYMFKK